MGDWLDAARGAVYVTPRTRRNEFVQVGRTYTFTLGGVDYPGAEMRGKPVQLIFDLVQVVWNRHGNKSVQVAAMLRDDDNRTTPEYTAYSVIVHCVIGSRGITPEMNQTRQLVNTAVQSHQN